MAFRVLVAWVLFSSALSWAARPARGAEMDGVRFPDQIQVGGKNLVLNGLGMRLATFLDIKVYVGALYLEHRSRDSQAILASPEIKRVEMAFVRGVGAGKLRDAWPEDLKSNCSSGCDAYAAPVSRLQALMTDMSGGDRMAFDIYPAKVDVWIKGKLAGTLSGPSGFPAQLLKDWIGHPGNSELKNGMLGLKP